MIFLRPYVLSILLLAALSVGCDDVVVFDVDAKGRVLVAADAAGAAPLVADGKKPRHLFWVDPTGGQVRRITKKPIALSWPRACDGGVLFVEKRKSLVLVGDGTRKVLYKTGSKKLFQPTVSRDGKRVLVLEATRLGVSGELKVIDTTTGRVIRSVSRALLGSSFARNGDLLVPRSREERTKAFEAGQGEIVQLGSSETVLFRGIVPGVTILSPTQGERVLGLLHLEGAAGPIGLAQFTAGKRGAKRGQTGVFDFWPSVSADQRQVLFTRSKGDDPQLTAELRLAASDDPAGSRVVATDGPVAAPRWVGARRIAFITKDNHLVLQDLDGSKRIDVTSALRAAYSSEESK